MVRIRNRSRDAIPGKIKQSDGTQVDTQFHPGDSTFPDGTVLVTNHIKLAVVVERQPQAAPAEPPKQRTPRRGRNRASESGASSGSTEAAT